MPTEELVCCRGCRGWYLVDDVDPCPVCSTDPLCDECVDPWNHVCNPGGDNG